MASCSHSNSKNEYTWNQFKTAAGQEIAFKIVQASKPSGWSAAVGGELTNDKFNINDDAQSIIVNITWTKANDKFNPSIDQFEIDYTDNAAYSIGLWTAGTPHAIYGPTWDRFKMVASSISANQLLAIAQPWTSDHQKTFIWEFGIATQRSWSKTETAKFDTFGSLTGTDSYQGMAGKPIIDESKQTVTAIISKTGKNGAYDSDPIKAIATYKKDQNYNINNWVFSKDTQL